VQAIALRFGDVGATRMIGPLLGGFAFQWATHEGRIHGDRTGPVRPAPLRWRALTHTQVTRRLAIMRIPAEILEGLAYARTNPSSCWCSASPS